MKGKVAADFRVQTYQGKPVLTWWEGQLFVGDGDGVGQVYDSSYKPDRAGADRQRLHVRPARVHDHAAQHRAGAGLRALQPQPDGVGRPEGREDRRQHRPGDRPRDRPRAVRVAQLRQRLARRVRHPGAQGEGLRVGVLPRQRGRSRQRRQLPRLRPQHVDDLQDQPRHGQDHVAPGRQEVDVQARSGREVRLAAQHPRAARRHATSSTTTRPRRRCARTRAC